MNIEKVGVKVGDVWEKDDNRIVEALKIFPDSNNQECVVVLKLDEEYADVVLPLEFKALLERDGQRVPQAGEWCTSEQWVTLLGGNWEEFEAAHEACGGEYFNGREWVTDRIFAYMDRKPRYRIRLADGQELPKVEDTKPEDQIQELEIIREGEHPEVRIDGYKKAIHKLAYKELIHGYVYDASYNPHVVSALPFMIRYDSDKHTTLFPYAVLVNVSGFKKGGE